MLVQVINPSRNVQVSCSLLELCGRHVVVFQVSVPQISLIRQLIYDVAESFTVWIFPKSRLLLIAHASFLTHLVPVWQMGLARLEVLFLLRNGVGILRSAADSHFSFINSVLDVDCTRGPSSSSSETLARSGRTRGLSSSSSSSSLVRELDMLIFALIVQKLHVFFWVRRPLTRFWLVRKTPQVQNNMSQSIQLERSTSQKPDM